MFWKRDSWNGFPHTPTFSTRERSMPSWANRLFAVSTMSPWATSSPDFMAKLTWSMTFIPGMGWRSVMTVPTVFPESRSSAWQRSPLVPMSNAIPYLTGLPPS